MSAGRACTQCFSCGCSRVPLHRRLAGRVAELFPFPQTFGGSHSARAALTRSEFTTAAQLRSLQRERTAETRTRAFISRTFMHVDELSTTRYLRLNPSHPAF